MLKKNPNYTGDRPAYADEIDYTQLTIDQNQGTLEAKNGQLDYINDAVVPAQNFQLNKEFGPDGTAGGHQRFFITPAAVDLVPRPEHRRATRSRTRRCARRSTGRINRKDILQPSGYGAGIPTDKYLPPQFPSAGFEESVYPLDSSDVDKAKQLIAGVRRADAAHRGAVHLQPGSPAPTAPRSSSRS